MPSGKTHDAVTALLAIPLAVAAYSLADITTAVLLTASFLFGGLMFGPDLDTVSTQRSRWGIFAFVWSPYRRVFKHRSRWSHGLLLGTLFRVVYFFGVSSLLVVGIAYAFSVYSGGDLPRFVELAAAWSRLGDLGRQYLGEYGYIFAFAGMWLGAAAHTIADIAGTYIKTGRTGRVF